MGKLKKNQELLQIMDDYVSFMDSKKKGSMPIVISEAKINHPSSLCAKIPIDSETSFGNVFIDLELRNKDSNNYSIQLVSDKIEKKILSRLDEGNGTHRNNLPSIPLQEQEVTTPHFHKYNSEGYFLAYRTEGLKSFGSHPMSINQGILEFCSEMNIHSCNGNHVDVIVREDGVLPLEFNIDPLDGINF